MNDEVSSMKITIKGTNNKPIEQPFIMRNGKLVINKKSFAQYTHSHNEIKMMKDDHRFWDYVAFLLRQQDIHQTEQIKDAINTTKNAKNMKTYQEFHKVSKTVGWSLLMVAAGICVVATIVYAYWFRNDIVKRDINLIFAGVMGGLVLLLLFYMFMYNKINGLSKKIMTLM